jgi:hypothetical protein
MHEAIRIIMRINEKLVRVNVSRGGECILRPLARFETRPRRERMDTCVTFSLNCFIHSLLNRWTDVSSGKTANQHTEELCLY